MTLLAIDTGGAASSVCLWRDGPLVERASSAPRAHARAALALVDEVLAAADMDLAQVDTYAFGEGPGGLTGLRVAASVVQAFALVTGARIVAVCNLEALARRAGGADAIVAAHDLGMGAVVWQSFVPDGAGGLRARGDAVLSEPAQVVWPDGRVGVVGSGAGLLAPPDGARVLDTLVASATDLAAVAAAGGGRVVAPQAAQPRYWRHPVYN